MIIRELVKTKWMNSNKDHYESLGYKYTGYKSELEVWSTDLPKGSAVKVNAICTKCDKTRSVAICKYKEICGKCNSMASIKIAHEKMRELKKDPEYSKIRKDNHSKMLSKLWSDPEYRAKQIERSIERFNKPESIQKAKDTRANYFNDPEKIESKRSKMRDLRIKRFSESEFSKIMTFDEFEKEWNDRRYNREIKDWRKAVYTRDGYICQICLKSNVGKINAHHLNSFHYCINERYSIDNGITLCNNHHKEFHNLYGNINNTKEQFFEYMSANFMTNFSSLNQILEFNKNVK